MAQRASVNPPTRPTPIQRRILPLGNPPPLPQVPVSAANGPLIGRQVLRVNRACNACRKQKMRCEGPDNPPCARCRAAGSQCIFEKVNKPDAPDPQTQRINDLEARWGVIEGRLSEVLGEIREVRTRLDATPVPEISPHTSNPQHLGQVETSSSPDEKSTNTPPVLPATKPASTGSQPSRPRVNTLHGDVQSQGSYGPQAISSASLPPIDQMLNTSHRRDSPLHNYLPPPTHSPSTPQNHHLPTFSSYPSGYQPSNLNPLRDSPKTAPAHFTASPGGIFKRRPVPSSAINSANNSEDEGELPSIALTAPISVLNDIAAAQPTFSDDGQGDSDSESSWDGPDGDVPSEAGWKGPYRPARGQSHASPHHRGPQGLTPSQKRKRRDSSTGATSRTSRNRFKIANSTSPDVSGARGSGPCERMASVSSTASRNRRKRSRDVVEKGIVSEAQAQELYRIYFSGCHRLLAVFDPKVDTFYNIRQRSPFLLCALLMVGSRVKDGANPPSDTQKALQEEATMIAKERAFESSGTVEDVQALLLLAGWSHTMKGVGWLTAGHAIRVAVEIGINKALQRLERRQSSGINTDNDRTLVTAARTWLALYVFEYQISFGTGRPAMMQPLNGAIESAKNILLQHPLSIATDARLVSTCDLLTRQGVIHEELEKREEIGDDHSMFEAVQHATKSIDDWLEEWDVRMGAASQPAGGFFRSSASIQRSYANLFHTCIALRSIKTVDDTKNISAEMKAIALQAITSAKECIEVCLNNEEYRKGLLYAVAYTHTCAAFAGAFLLRFARLFPEDVDLGETTRLVEELASLLNQVPAQKFALCLQRMLGHSLMRIQNTKTQSSDGETIESATSASSPSAQFISHGSVPQMDHHNLVQPEVTHMMPPVAVPTLTTQFSNDFANIVHPNPHRGRFVNHTTSHHVTHPTTNAFAIHDGGMNSMQSPGLGIYGAHPAIEEAPFSDASMGSVLEGFFGDGHDWAPWISTSIGGDLGLPMQTPLSADLTTHFPWHAT